jgi:hypothetical protein
MEKELSKFLKELHKSKKISIAEISDGYHTFSELYEHRNLLFITVARLFSENNAYVWKSVRDKYGKNTNRWFVLGIDYMPPSEKKLMQITYHLPMSLWSFCKFASTVPKSLWNGHDSKDVIVQLKEILKHD